MSSSRRPRPHRPAAPGPVSAPTEHPAVGTVEAAERVPLTFAQVREKLRRPRDIVPMVLDAEAAADIDHLAEELERAKARDELAPDGDRHAPEIARLLQAAEQRAESSVVDFVLEAVSHTAYRELQAENPAAPERLAEIEAAVGEKWAFDPDVIAPLLVRAQLVSPVPDSDEDWQEFWEALSDGQLRHLWVRALGLQMRVTRIGPRSDVAAEVLREG